MRLERTLWKVFSIQRDELRFALPLFALYLLSGSFYAIGQIITETLFLKAYGAAGLSRFFIFNGIALIVGGVVYTNIVTRFSLRKGYLALILLFSSLIVAGAHAPLYEYSWVPFYLYLGNYLFTFFLDIHFFNYATQFCNVRSAKRILPFVMAGGKMGGIVSSLLIFWRFSQDIETVGLLWWAINGFLLVGPLALLRKKNAGVLPPASRSDDDLLGGRGLMGLLADKLAATYSSPIFLYSALAVFVMSVANQVSEYYFASIFNAAFTSKRDLAAFLSAYTVLADGATLLLQMLVVSRLITAIGVKKSNVLYPLSFIGSIVLALSFPTLVAGVLLRFYRKHLSVLVRAPVFNVIMAAAPAERLTAVKSFIGGIISPLGMIAGGGAIMLVFSRFEPAIVSAIAIAIGLAYVGFTLLQNRAYVRALRDRIEHGIQADDAPEADYRDFVRFVARGGRVERHLGALEGIVRTHRSFEAMRLIEPHFARLQTPTRLALVRLAATGSPEERRTILMRAVADPEQSVRAAALELVRTYPYGERTPFLAAYHPDAGPIERDAVRALGTATGADPDGFAARRLRELAAGVENGTARDTDLRLFVAALPPGLYLETLVRIAVATGSLVLARAVIPHADSLSPDDAKAVFRVLLNGSREDIINFCTLAERLELEDRLALLTGEIEFRPDELERVFAKSDEAYRAAVAMLFEERSYECKSNCLACLIALGYKPEGEMYEYISYVMIQILEALEVKNSVRTHADRAVRGVPIASFVEIALASEIALQKRLILKAISILSGTHIDEAYDASLFVMDRSLNSYILEFLEAYGRHTRQALFIFEDERDLSEVVVLERSLFDTELLSAILRCSSFLPRSSSLLQVCRTALLDDPHSAAIESDPEVAAMLTIMEKIIFLNDSSLFAELHVEELMRLAAIAREIELPRGSAFITEGDDGDDLFIVIDGEVEVFTAEKVVATLGRGSCIGELAIIDREPRVASVRTVTPARLLSVSRRDFLLTLKDNPVIAINILKVIADRLRKLL
ncbi:MAG TPA: cyclic nucleotide-binding domain-containing protein [Spirochaetota bacterium]|nr:cyclic nucleotide-binding domain-containing protein [Spirochaetota bacterium]HPU88754.1 cyclic nucleotide-binding domain-containing protein [Spirochaetota bacterium]